MCETRNHGLRVRGCYSTAGEVRATLCAKASSILAYTRRSSAVGDDGLPVFVNPSGVQFSSGPAFMWRVMCGSEFGYRNGGERGGGLGKEKMPGIARRAAIHGWGSAIQFCTRKDELYNPFPPPTLPPLTFAFVMPKQCVFLFSNRTEMKVEDVLLTRKRRIRATLTNE